MKAIILLSIALLNGCFYSVHTTREQVATLTDTQIYQKLTATGLGEVEINEGFFYDELKKRKLISDQELTAIKNEQVFIGMSEYALLLSKRYYHDKNNTHTSSGKSVQYVFGSDPRNRMYVYCNNGFVTAIQD